MIGSFDELIHAERGKLLAKLPRGAQVFCSAGCAGRWYFDWIEECYGPVPLHYGVELYSPVPEDLPPNVIWIQNSAGAMSDVPTGSVDILFSGQNVEHLYLDDLRGFFREANRVIRPDGILCLDSPNRAITQAAGYTQPQHVLEFSVEEALALVEASGFEVDSVHGIWSCRDGARLFDDVTSLIGAVEERRTWAFEHPQDAFVWWIVARKGGKVTPRLDSTIDRIASRFFPSFVQSRFRKVGGTLAEMEGTELTLRVAKDEWDCVFHGPYVPLRAGDYVASFDHKFLKQGGGLVADVVSGGGSTVHAHSKIRPKPMGEWTRTNLRFSLDSYTDAIEARLFNSGSEAIVRFGAQIVRS